MITKAEYDILNAKEIKDGTCESDPFIRKNESLIKGLVKHGLIKIDNDGWGEDWYYLTSRGRLELNLYGRE